MSLWLASLIPITCTVPFEEDEKDPTVWFLDRDYAENMTQMFKKVNCMYNFIMAKICRWITVVYFSQGKSYRMVP